MALTQQDWYSKLKSWSPGWFFEDEVLNEGVFQGIAAVFAAIEADIALLQSQTFFMQATAPYLDALGDERSADRSSGELDSTYSGRIRVLVNSCNLPALQAMATSLLATGVATICGPKTGLFSDRNVFSDRRAILNDNWYNAFMIVIDTQPVGSTGDNALNAVASAIEAAKAGGVLFKIVEMHT